MNPGIPGYPRPKGVNRNRTHGWGYLRTQVILDALIVPGQISNLLYLHIVLIGIFTSKHVEKAIK